MAAKKATKTVTDTGLKIDFESGEVLELSLDQFNEDIVRKLALHGLSQKVGDSYAGAEATEAYELASGVSERLIAGEWTQTSTGGGTIRVSMLVEALAAATQQDVDAALEVVKNMSDEQKKQLRKHPAIAKELADLQAKRAAEKAAKAAEAAQASGGEGFDLSQFGAPAQ